MPTVTFDFKEQEQVIEALNAEEEVMSEEHDSDEEEMQLLQLIRATSSPRAIFGRYGDDEFNDLPIPIPGTCMRPFLSCPALLSVSLCLSCYNPHSNHPSSSSSSSLSSPSPTLPSPTPYTYEHRPHHQGALPGYRSSVPGGLNRGARGGHM